MERQCLRVAVLVLVIALVAGGVVVGDAIVLRPLVSANGCAEPSDPITAAPSQASDLLVGTWISCTGVSAFPARVPDGEVGLQFAADGRWYRVYRVGDGALVRPGGLDHEGAWDIDDSTGQLNIYVDGGQWIGFPAFFATPQMVRIGDSMTFETLDYRRSTEPDPVPGTPPGVGTGPCGLPMDFVAPGSAEEVQRLLAGTWIRCSERSNLGAISQHEVGIEFTESGQWSRVYRAGDESLIRAGGLGQHGTYEVAYYGDASDSWIQLDLMANDGMLYGGNPVFLRSPPFLRLGGYPPDDLLRWTGPPPTPGPIPGAESWPCGDPAAPITLTSAEQTGELLVGVWLRCQGPSFDEEIGFQFTADGNWYDIHAGADDTLRRDWRGTWRVDDLGLPGRGSR